MENVSILHSREGHKLITWRRRPPEARLKECGPCTHTPWSLSATLEWLLWNSSPNGPVLGHTVFQGMSLLCSPLPGKAIKLSFLLYQKTLSPRFNSAQVHRGRVFGIKTSMRAKPWVTPELKQTTPTICVLAHNLQKLWVNEKKNKLMTLCSFFTSTFLGASLGVGGLPSLWFPVMFS